MTLPTHLRLALASAALVLAVLSRGDVLVLAALVALVAARPLPSLGVVLALLASGWRWSSTALEDLAGAQAVLGPAGLVEPAAAAWLAALALVAAAPAWSTGPGRAWPGRAWPDGAWPDGAWPDGAWPDRAAALLAAGALGATAAVVVAGPAPGGALWARVLAGALATVAALGVGRRRARPRWAAGFDALAVTAGVAALGLVATDGRSWEGVLDAAAAVEGLVVAVAAAALVAVAAAVPRAMERSRA